MNDHLPERSLRGIRFSSRRDDVISPRATLTFVLPRVFDFGQFDTDFFENRRSTGEPPTERVDKTIVALGSLRSRGRARLLRERRRRRQPEADEQGYRLKRNSVVALKPLEYSHDAVEPLGDRGLPPIGIVGRKKRPNRGLGNQRLGFALTLGIGLQASEYLWIEVDAELDLFHRARS